MSYELYQAQKPVEVVARSQRGMLDAVRRALSGASRTMGGLDRCDATLSPQVVSNGSDSHFQIMLSVTKRGAARLQR